MKRIYARYEYPIDLVPNEKVFDEYRHLSGDDLLTVAIREYPNRAAIILTYAEDTDLFMHLKLMGVKDANITRYIDRKQNG